MLLRRETLDKIEAGDVDLVFRRWKRPTVKSGGRLRTQAGVLEIRSVSRVEPSELVESEARRAGFENLNSLLVMLRSRDTGDIYRVEVGGLGPDPRVELRNRSDFDRAELEAIQEGLSSLDRRSKTGPWTRSYLALIAGRPHVSAETLATSVGVEKQTFKRRVRQLKELGLTISRSPGYELSPRGEEVLKRLGI